MQIAHELVNACHHYLDMRCVYFFYYHIWRYLRFSSWVFEFAQNIWIFFIIFFFASFWKLVEELVGSKSHLFCQLKTKTLKKNCINFKCNLSNVSLNVGFNIVFKCNIQCCLQAQSFDVASKCTIIWRHLLNMHGHIKELGLLARWTKFTLGHMSTFMTLEWLHVHSTSWILPPKWLPW
jgi:hypothetical protein